MEDLEGVTQPWRPPDKRPIAIWLGSAAPLRSIRWLDGALALADKLGPATAIAAGDPTWLDLAADRATRAKLACVGVMTDLQLDYLGWAQIAAAVVRSVGASTILVDEASRPERYAEVAAIAELLDAAQLTHVVSMVADGKVIHANRAAGRELQSVRVRGPAVIGVRIAGAAIDEYPTPMPSAAMRRLDLAGLGLDPVVLAHRAVSSRASQEPRRTIEQVVDMLAVYAVPDAVPAPPLGTRKVSRAKTLDDTDPVRRTDPDHKILSGEARTRNLDSTRTTDPDGKKHRGFDATRTTDPDVKVVPEPRGWSTPDPERHGRLDEPTVDAPHRPTPYQRPLTPDPTRKRDDEFSRGPTLDPEGRRRASTPPAPARTVDRPFDPGKKTPTPELDPNRRRATTSDPLAPTPDPEARPHRAPTSDPAPRRAPTADPTRTTDPDGRANDPPRRPPTKPGREDH